MLDIFVTARKVIREANVHSYLNSGVLICSVNNATSGLRLAGNIITSVVDKTTVLFLSGGKTPKELYQELAKVRKLHPGAIGLVDERYAEGSMHKESNEKMLTDAGLLQYFQSRAVPFYSILQKNTHRHSGDDPSADGEDSRISKRERSWTSQDDEGRGKATELYDEQVRSLLSLYQNRIAILGIGLDGHTAGLPASARLWQAGLPAQNSKLPLRSEASKIQNSKIYTTTDLVTEYNDTSGVYGERITMTFLALSMMDLLLVLVFGKKKKRALELLFSEGSEEEIPARFFKRPDIVKKTILITDQQV